MQLVCLCSKYEVSKKGEVLKLLVKNLTEADAGEYTCQIGERTTNCQVTIEECESPGLLCLLFVQVVFLNFINVIAF